MAPSRRAWLLSAAYVIVACGACLAAARPAGSRAGAYLAVHAALTALMFVAWRGLRERADLTLALATGVVARVALVGVASFTTTDVPRYLWDGAVLLASRDPYALPPIAVELAPLRAVFPMPVDHLDVATCYPPLALGLFALASLFGPTGAWWAWKALVCAASSYTTLLAWRALRDTERRHDVVLCAWSPLLVLESGVGAHLDVLVALCLMAAVVWLRERRDVASALAAGVAVALKFVPALALLPLACGTRRPVWYSALALAPVALTMGAAELMGLTAPGSLPFVAENWSFAAPLWTWLYERHPLEDETIRASLSLAAVATIALVSLRPGVARNVRDSLGAHLATTPALYPWYGSSLAALTSLAPSAWSLALVAAIPFSYEVLDLYQSAGVWSPARWPMHLNAAAMAFGLYLDATMRWRRPRAP